jgi:hypothetical protein
MRRRDILILLGVVLITPLGAAARKTWRRAFFNLPPSVNDSVSGAFVHNARCCRLRRDIVLKLRRP